MRATLQSSLAIQPTGAPYEDRDLYVGSDGNNFSMRISSNGAIEYDKPPVYLTPTREYGSLIAPPNRGNFLNTYETSGKYQTQISAVSGFGIITHDTGWNTLYDTALIYGTYYGGTAQFTVTVRRVEDSVVLGYTRFIFQE